MKTYVMVIICILASKSLYSQNNDGISPTIFEYAEEGLNDYVVTTIESKTKEEIYSKTINWIKETYKNPNVVLTMQIENEKIRIDAIANGLLKVKSIASNLNYVVEISFKDYKYKFELVSLLYENSTDYKKIPNFKTDKKYSKNFGNTPYDIENHFNSLNESLKNYILGKSKEEKW